LPLFIASSCSISGFIYRRSRVFFPKTWKRFDPLTWPFVNGVGIGLSIRNAKAGPRSAFSGQIEFVRTPKIQSEGQGAGTWKKKGYRNRVGWMP